MKKVTTTKTANLLSTNKNIREIKKVLRQDHYFSTRLPYANKRIREIWTNMVNTTYNSTEDIINKLQSLKGKTKLKFYKDVSNYYDNMNIKMDDFTSINYIEKHIINILLFDLLIYHIQDDEQLAISTIIIIHLIIKHRYIISISVII